METFIGSLQNPVAGRLWDQITGRSRDVCWTSVKHESYLQVSQDFIVNGSHKKFSGQYSD